MLMRQATILAGATVGILVSMTLVMHSQQSCHNRHKVRACMLQFLVANAAEHTLAILGRV